MLRYLVALFLINTYSRSLGAPADQQTASPTIAAQLDSLAKNCANVFIKTQIGISKQNCLTTDQNRLIECLIFYDINSQLCTAINNSKNFDLNEEEFLAQTKNEFYVKDLCNHAIEWTFSSNMNASLLKVFQDPVICEKICGVTDIFSADSNFYCKYFNWGWKKLNPPKKSVSQTMSVVSASAAMSQGALPAKMERGQTISSGTPNLTNTETSSLNLKEKPEENDSNDIEVPITQRSPETSVPNSLPTVPMVSANPGVKEYDNAKEVKDNDNAKPSSDPNVGNKPNINNSKNITSQPKPKLDQIHKVEDDNGEENFANEMDADDEDNMDDGEVAENPIIPKEIPSGEITFKEHYYPDPEDGHFFPFFLTAIVLVVLVYILYHNKGRVTKVILGLIVEGRQNGRRRNSRGHAYRRLDTLEQAMSGNLAAQPSKIIY